jgi:hypothetical protein
MKVPYGFAVDNDGRVTVDKTQAQTIQMIFREYLNADSLGGLARMLESRNIPSPSGNKCWGRAAIDKLLSSSKYVPLIISLELYTAVQFEKAARSTQELNNDGSAQRKATRYNSKHVLSGRLVCSECGANYPGLQGPLEKWYGVAQPCGTQKLHAFPINGREGYTSVNLQGTRMDTLTRACQDLLDQIQIGHAGSISFEYRHIQRFYFF